MASNGLTAITLLIGALASFASPGAHAIDVECPYSLKYRTAEQVMESHHAALAAGNWQAVGCNYATGAIVLHDQGMTQGRDAIVAGLKAAIELYEGIIPQLNEQVIVPIIGSAAMARVLWSVSTRCIDVEDGADTYIIKDGKITAQNAHGFRTFRCDP